MRSYKCLAVNHFSNGSYSLVPIRDEDKYQIMKWRNEQIYHLRQVKHLTEKEQDIYFQTVVSNLFEDSFPLQILFSFMKNKKCIGYGGLVHIDWENKNAEISFVMDTNLEKNNFEEIWSLYLKLLEKIAFLELKFHKIYTYAYDLRPKLYQIFEKNKFQRDAVLRQHLLFNGEFINVVIHSKINPYESN